VRDVAACRAFYERHFEFAPAFEAEGGIFLRNNAGFLLALVPVDEHRSLPDGFHIGFKLDSAEDVVAMRSALERDGVRVNELHDGRPGDQYVSFRCWDPDGTEVELFWEQ
jgi:catechol 2,3-dioxygenase-like lactoylglutathione lyase family enzyme